MSRKITVEEIEFLSEGYKLKGGVYRPSGRGKHPAVLICHGFPGNTKNMDLATVLALNGITALIFYYRGAWGSEGDYSISATIPSTRDALAYLRGLPYVDAERVGIVSHSMGTMPNVATLGNDKSLRVGAMMGPVSDISMWGKEPALSSMVAALTHSAEGRLTNYKGDAIKKDLKEVSKKYNPIGGIGKITCPILLIVGADDHVTPVDGCRKLYAAAKAEKKIVEVLESDHDFSEHRHVLIPEVLAWLKQHL